jgi:hypothetical protein
MGFVNRPLRNVTRCFLNSLIQHAVIMADAGAPRQQTPDKYGAVRQEEG